VRRGDRLAKSWAIVGDKKSIAKRWWRLLRKVCVVVRILTKREQEVAKKAKKAAKTKKAVRREYSKADVRELRAHSKARTPVVKIAKLTKRSEGSLRQKARALGIGLGHQR